MLRAWRAEILWIAAIASVSLVLGLILGQLRLLLSIGLVVYLGWHAFHLALLLHWIAGGQRTRLPVTMALWEAVFDGLQGRQLRDRRRRRSIAGMLSEFRDSATRLPDAVVLLDERNRILWFNGCLLYTSPSPRDS